MEITTRRTGRAMIVDVEGQPAEPGFAPVVLDLLERGEKRIVLSLRLRRFDSNCLGEATVCHLKAKRRGADLKIVSTDPRLWKLVECLKLDRVLHYYRSEEEALASFPR